MTFHGDTLSRSLVALVLAPFLLLAACGTVEDDELSLVTSAINTVDCARPSPTIPTDRTLSTLSQQLGPWYTPQTYNNPGCYQGYIVKYSGGYKPETPAPGANEGIILGFKNFPHLSDGPTEAYCQDRYIYGGYLYRDDGNGVWTLIQSKFKRGHLFCMGNHCIPSERICAGNFRYTTSALVKGRIYRLAITGHDLYEDDTFEVQGASLDANHPYDLWWLGSAGWAPSLE